MLPAATTRKPQQRTTETKGSILRASLQEFARHGFDGASIRRIAALARVNHGLIKHHFGSKDDLWQATVRFAFDGYEARLERRAKGLEGVGEREFLRLMLREFVLFSAERPELNRILVHANGDPARTRWFVDEVLSASRYSPLTGIERAQRAGVFVAGDPARLHYLFIGAATSIFAYAAEFEIVTGQDPFDPTVVEEHVETMLSIFSSGSES